MDPRELERRCGTVLCGKYTLERLIGFGGMAAVYQGIHRNGHRVAVKMLHPAFSFDLDSRRRFLREGYAANKVGHPGVVRVTDDDIAEDGAAFLVMDLLDGQTLWDHIASCGGIMTASEIVPLVCQLLEVLVAAHDKGIVHRDIKPENLFLERGTGALKVLDFGIARMTGVHRATRTGGLMGTPGYMAPEQARGQTRLIGPQSDLWSVGAILFRSLSGHPVFRDETPEMVLIKTAMEPPPPLASLAPQIEPELSDIVDRALAFDREHRWPSAESMLHALRAFEAGGLSNGYEPGGRDSLGMSITEPRVPVANARTAAQPSDGGVGPRLDGMLAAGPPPMAPALDSSPRDRGTGITPYAMEHSVPSGVRPGAAKRSRLVLAATIGAPVLLVFAALVVAPRVGTSKAPPPAPGTSTVAVTRAEPEATALSAPVSAGERSALANTPPSTLSSRDGGPRAPAQPAPFAKPAPSAKRAVNCNPNYYFENNGVKRYKEECL